MDNLKNKQEEIKAIQPSRKIFGKIFTNFAAKLLAVVLGAIIYYAVLQVVFWFGLNSDYLKLLTAVIVAIFLALPYWKAKYFNKPVKRGNDHAGN